MSDIDLGGLPEDVREALFRLQQKVSLWKWAIGTVGLTVMTTVASWYFQNREVRLEEVRFAHLQEMQELEFEQKYLGEFLEYALVEDINSRLRFAHYFASVSTNDALTNRWRAYYDDLLKNISTSPDDEPDGAAAIGGIEALTGRKITRIWLGAEAVGTMADFRAHHVDTLGWSDIGFHFYVDLNGAVQLARPIGKTPAFVLSHNTGAVAIAVACSGWVDVTQSSPEGTQCDLSFAQKEAVQTLVAKLLVDYNLDASIVGKRSEFRPVPDLLGSFVTEVQDALLGPRPRKQ